MACPVGIPSCVGYCCHTASLLSECPAGNDIRHCVLRFSTSRGEIQHFFPHGNQITHINLLSCVLLGDLNFQHLVCMLQTPEKRMDRFSHLEINGSVFNLENDIIIEFSVQRHEVVVSGTCPVCPAVTPVLLAVVHKTSPYDGPSVRFNRAGQHIGTVCMVPPVGKGSGTSFGICFYKKRIAT